MSKKLQLPAIKIILNNPPPRSSILYVFLYFSMQTSFGITKNNRFVYITQKCMCKYGNFLPLHSSSSHEMRKKN